MGQGIQVQAQTHQTVQNVDNNDTNVKEVFDGESTLTTPQTNTEGKYKHNEDSGTDLKQGSHVAKLLFKSILNLLIVSTSGLIVFPSAFCRLFSACWINKVWTSRLQQNWNQD
jgi:hypothetical protein